MYTTTASIRNFSDSGYSSVLLRGMNIIEEEVPM